MNGNALDLQTYLELYSILYIFQEIPYNDQLSVLCIFSFHCFLYHQIRERGHDPTELIKFLDKEEKGGREGEGDEKEGEKMLLPY